MTGPKCEWCGEPGNEEMGAVMGLGMLFHDGCRKSYIRHEAQSLELQDNLRLRVRRMVLMFEGDLEAVDDKPTSEAQMLGDFIDYVRSTNWDTWVDLTNKPLHGEGSERL